MPYRFKHLQAKSFMTIIAFLGVSLSVQAQLPTPNQSASELILQQQREKALQQQIEPTSDVPGMQIAPMPLAVVKIPDEQPCFTIHTIELSGELSNKFQWALKAANRDDKKGTDPAINRCLGATGINIVMGRIQNVIIEKGYITTRVVAAEQDLTQGVLKLTLIPGKVHAVRFAEGSSQRINWRSALPMREGDLLNLRDLEQALEVFKRVPTTDVDIQIEPTGDAGQSDLVITWKEKFPFRVNLSLDDAGGRDTSRYQGALTVSYDNPFALNDLFYVSYNRGLGDGNGGRSQGYSVHYSVPIKGNWLVSLSTSQYRYHQVIAGQNQDYDYKGTSQNVDVTLSRRIYRDATKRLNFYAKGWMRRSQNYIDENEIYNQKRKVAGWEVGAEYRQFIGNAILNANLSYRRGTGALDALRSPFEQTGEGTSRMKIYGLDASLTVPIKIGQQQFRYMGTFRAQWNGTRLVPQDQFSIGGRYTVRGFDGRSSLMGDRGWLLRNDFGWQVFSTGQELYWGLDFGSVSGPSVRYQVGQNLTGTVLGLRGGITKHVNYDAFVGTWLHKPDQFKTSKWTSGVTVNFSF